MNFVLRVVRSISNNMQILGVALNTRKDSKPRKTHGFSTVTTYIRVKFVMSSLLTICSYYFMFSLRCDTPLNIYYEWYTRCTN